MSENVYEFTDQNFESDVQKNKLSDFQNIDGVDHIAEIRNLFLLFPILI